MSSSNDHRGDCPVSPTSSSTAMASSSSSPTRRRHSSSTTGSYQSPGTRRLSAGGSPRRRGQHQLRRYNTPPVGSLAAGLRGNTTVEVVRPQEVGGEGEDGNNNKANQLSGAHEHLQQPPLGVTGVLCESHHVPVHGRGILHYTVYRPRLLHASGGGGAAGGTGAPPVAAAAAALQVGAPLICIAGGPGLPSTYLQSLTYTITDRAVVLYDAIGCGQSPATVFDDDDNNNKEEQHQAPQEAEDIPADGTVEAAVYDLRALLDHLPGCTAFHLLGHSWGGCVAYEYARTTAMTTPMKNHHSSGNIKQRKKKHCRSVILCSAPTSMQATLDECQRLLKVVQQELGVIGSEDDEDAMKRAHSLFVHRHECRLQPMPLPLEQAFSMAGFGSCGGVLGGGRGLANPAVRDWRIGSQKDAASEEAEDSRASGKATTAEKLESPPVLILTGQFDFVKDPGEWEEIFANFAAEELSDCSHYGMLERPSVFGTTCTKFLQQHDASKSTKEENVLSNDNRVDAGDTASSNNNPVIIQEEEEEQEEEE